MQHIQQQVRHARVIQGIIHQHISGQIIDRQQSIGQITHSTGYKHKHSGMIIGGHKQHVAINKHGNTNIEQVKIMHVIIDHTIQYTNI